ncbi:MAG: 50S ribosomal protein L21e [Candidatus Aenigmarchaeota archaeon]|nr:50S ribosomal protein L21e [Candidatus Aenigmarchaeota archaeon]
MVRKSYGKMRGTRFKLQGRAPKNMRLYLAEFEPGRKVNVQFTGHKGIPNPKFQGKTGTVLEKRGDGYEVQVSDGNSTKKIYVKPQHLRGA